MNRISVLIFALAQLASIGALATAKEGGGGAQIESAFRLRGIELISEVANSPAATALCAASVMKIGLESSQIRVVSTLTGAPAGQSLDAWTSPGDIQLLLNSWQNFFDPTFPMAGRSVDALILHEIYRSTGVCNDDKFIISDKVFELTRESRKYSKTFVFPYSVNIEGSSAACDRVPGVHALATCAIDGSAIVMDNGVYIGTVTVNENGDPIVESGEGEYWFPLPREKVIAQFGRVDSNLWANLARQASQTMPFIFVLDLQTGAGAYGLDPAALNTIEEESP